MEQEIIKSLLIQHGFVTLPPAAATYLGKWAEKDEESLKPFHVFHNTPTPMKVIGECFGSTSWIVEASYDGPYYKYKLISPVWMHPPEEAI